MATYSSILAWRIPWTERGAWWATVHGVAKNQTQLSIHTYLFICIYLASVLIEAYEIFDLCDGMQDFFLSFGM